MIIWCICSVSIIVCSSPESYRERLESEPKEALRSCGGICGVKEYQNGVMKMGRDISRAERSQESEDKVTWSCVLISFNQMMCWGCLPEELTCFILLLCNINKGWEVSFVSNQKRAVSGPVHGLENSQHQPSNPAAIPVLWWNDRAMSAVDKQLYERAVSCAEIKSKVNVELCVVVLK